jgi:hypothetical protein
MTNLSQLESDWFGKRSGLIGKRSPEEHKRAYFVSKGISGAGKNLSQMEYEWLVSISGGLGGQWDSELWKQACVTQGAPTTPHLVQNKINFFLNVAGSP